MAKLASISTLMWELKLGDSEGAELYIEDSRCNRLSAEGDDYHVKDRFRWADVVGIDFQVC